MDADPKPRDSDPDNWYVPHVIILKLFLSKSQAWCILLEACDQGANLIYNNFIGFLSFFVSSMGLLPPSDLIACLCLFRFIKRTNCFACYSWSNLLLVDSVVIKGKRLIKVYNASRSKLFAYASFFSTF